MYYIEIETVDEGPRLKWAAIYADSNMDRALAYGHTLIRGLNPAPYIRITEGHAGTVIGAWQDEGWTES